MPEQEYSPRGVNYATDSDPEKPEHATFHPELNRNLGNNELAEEMRFIADELHCDSLRVFGQTATEAAKVARVAQEQGVEPWLSPRFLNTTFEETREILTGYVRHCAEAGLQSSPLIVGNELSIDCATDPVTGEVQTLDYKDRAHHIGKDYIRKGVPLDVTAQVKQLMEDARDAGWEGPLVYAALGAEVIDWDQIEDDNVIVAANLYWGRNRETGEPWTEKEYGQKLDEIIASAKGRPVVLTEFGASPQDSPLNASGGSYNDEAALSYEAQAAAYERYLKVITDREIGYFAYTLHEPKEHPNKYGIPNERIPAGYDRDRSHQSFGIVHTDERHVASRLTPAGEVLARYNQGARETHGAIIED